MIVERGYLDHWKTQLLRTRTGLQNASELPLRLWEYCESRMDAMIADKDGSIIAAICRWPHDPATLVDALLACRWIESAEGGYIVHGWADRQRGYYAKRLNGQKGGRPKGSKSEKNGPETQKTEGKGFQEKDILQVSVGSENGNQTETEENLQVILGSENGNQTETEENLQVILGSENETEENLQVPNKNLQGGRGDERRGDEKRITPPSPCGDGEQVGLTASEVLDRVCKIWGRKPGSRVSYEATSALAHAMPITEEELALVEWFYRLPASSTDHELKTRHRSVEKLLINWPKAVDEATVYAKKAGGPVRKPQDEIPPAEVWLEVFHELYPGVRPPSALWSGLPDYCQREIRSQISARKKIAAKKEGGAQ